MSRHNAREEVFKLIYERLVTGEANEFTLELLTEDKDEDDTAYINRLFKTVNENFDGLKEIIGRLSEGFSFIRLIKTDCAALMTAACEILLFEDIPDKVAINEAVELVKVYSDEKSGRFVNGVLASVVADKENLKNELDSYRR